MGGVDLVLGGIRSGKSEHAESLVLDYGAGGKGGARVVSYLATGVSFDVGMRDRILVHRERRLLYGWDLHEESIDIVSVLSGLDGCEHVVLLDCLSSWLGNLYHGGHGVEERVAELLNFLGGYSGHIVIVSSEVGMSLVPSDSVSANFCDELGSLNRGIAAISGSVYLVVAGIAIDLKR